MKERPIHSILFTALMLLLFLPLAQMFFSPFEFKPLMGYFEQTEKPVPDLESLKNGSFQEEYSAWFEDHVGFKPMLTRIHNQLNFSLFNTTGVQKVVIGKEGVLYEDNYIEAFFGRDRVPSERISKRLEILSSLRDSLLNNGKDILVVLAPNKARFFPEYIPDPLTHPGSTESNYSIITEGLQRRGILFIDFNRWFRSQKELSPYPLYPKCGIHWSVYGLSLAADSMIQFINQNTRFTLPTMEMEDLSTRDEYKYPDNDIADAMNLLWDANHEVLAYPRLRFNQGTSKPRTMVVGDSYYNSFFYEGYHQALFEQGSFWYYNDKVFRQSLESGEPVKDVNFKEENDQTELYILLFTEPNLSDLGFGFIEDLYQLYTNPKAADTAYYLNEVKSQMEYIRSDSVWMNSILEKASQENRSLEEQLRLDAEWAINEKIKKAP